MVLVGYDSTVGPSAAREASQDLGQRRQGREEAGEMGGGAAEAAHVRVRRDDVDVALVQGRDGACPPPVDQVRGQEEDVVEQDAGRLGDLQEGLGGQVAAEVVRQGSGEGGGGGEVREDGGEVREEEQGEVGG